MPSESGMDGHDEHQVGTVKERDQSVNGGLRIDGDADLQSPLPDPIDCRMDVPFGFAVHRDGIASCIREGIDVSDRVVDHEVGIEELVRVSPDGLDDRRSERYVGHEHPVHNIQVDPIGAGLVCSGDLLAESGEVCR